MADLSLEEGISYSKEAELLDLLMSVGRNLPPACVKCHCRISSETQWKPSVAFYFNDAKTGYDRVVTEILCGPCSQAEAADG